MSQAGTLATPVLVAGATVVPLTERLHVALLVRFLFF